MDWIEPERQNWTGIPVPNTELYQTLPIETGGSDKIWYSFHLGQILTRRRQILSSR